MVSCICLRVTTPMRKKQKDTDPAMKDQAESLRTIKPRQPTATTFAERSCVSNRNRMGRIQFPTEIFFRKMVRRVVLKFMSWDAGILTVFQSIKKPNSYTSVM